MDLKLIISDAFQFFRHHIGQIATLCIPWLLAIAVVEYLIVSASNNPEDIGSLMLAARMFSLLIYPIYTAALIRLMAMRAQREAPKNSELLASAFKLWQPFFTVHIAGFALMIIGLMFFILPGVYIVIRLSFAEFYIVLEDIKPMEALQKSFRVTRPYVLQIFILMILFAGPLLLLSFILSDMISNLAAAPLLNIAGATIIGFLMLFLDVVVFRFYMAVTQEHPGSGNPSPD